jgi:predicted dehydrogenase
MRLHPGLISVKRLLERGVLGRVIALRAEVGQYLPDWRPWQDYRKSYSARREDGGGIILDAIHEFDYCRWLLGEVKTVACFADRLSNLEIDTEDTAAVLVRFASGAIGEIHMDYVQRTSGRGCQVIGEQGTIWWSYPSSEVRWYSAETQKWEVFRGPNDWTPNQMYLDEMRHFLRSVAGQEQSVMDVGEAKRVLDIALGAKLSAEKGCVVKLRGTK